MVGLRRGWRGRRGRRLPLIIKAVGINDFFPTPMDRMDGILGNFGMDEGDGQDGVDAEAQRDSGLRRNDGKMWNDGKMRNDGWGFAG